MLQVYDSYPFIPSRHTSHCPAPGFSIGLLIAVQEIHAALQSKEAVQSLERFFPHRLRGIHTDCLHIQIYHKTTMILASRSWKLHIFRVSLLYMIYVYVFVHMCDAVVMFASGIVQHDLCQTLNMLSACSCPTLINHMIRKDRNHIVDGRNPAPPRMYI